MASISRVERHRIALCAGAARGCDGTGASVSEHLAVTLSPQNGIERQILDTTRALYYALEDAADMLHECASECGDCDGDGVQLDGGVCQACATTREAERRARASQGLVPKIEQLGQHSEEARQRSVTAVSHESGRLRAERDLALKVCLALRDRYYPFGPPSEGSGRIYTMACDAIHKIERGEVEPPAKSDAALTQELSQVTQELREAAGLISHTDPHGWSVSGPGAGRATLYADGDAGARPARSGEVMKQYYSQMVCIEVLAESPEEAHRIASHTPLAIDKIDGVNSVWMVGNLVPEAPLVKPEPVNRGSPTLLEALDRLNLEVIHFRSRGRGIQFLINGLLEALEQSRGVAIRQASAEVSRAEMIERLRDCRDSLMRPGGEPVYSPAEIAVAIDAAIGELPAEVA
ncbi:MAG: hypothetical protein JWL65_2698, partial [Gammaproteobacteria bacterium]|nr:hypothetical protein [Gammaproteobacteria bacterium]